MVMINNMWIYLLPFFVIIITGWILVLILLSCVHPNYLKNIMNDYSLKLIYLIYTLFICYINDIRLLPVLNYCLWLL